MPAFQVDIYTPRLPTLPNIETPGIEARIFACAPAVPWSEEYEHQAQLAESGHAAIRYIAGMFVTGRYPSLHRSHQDILIVVLESRDTLVQLYDGYHFERRVRQKGMPVPLDSPMKHAQKAHVFRAFIGGLEEDGSGRFLDFTSKASRFLECIYYERVIPSLDIWVDHIMTHYHPDVPRKPRDDIRYFQRCKIRRQNVAAIERALEGLEAVMVEHALDSGDKELQGG